MDDNIIAFPEDFSQRDLEVEADDRQDAAGELKQLFAEGPLGNGERSDPCTCPMSLREAGNHSVACPLYKER